MEKIKPARPVNQEEEQQKQYIRTKIGNRIKELRETAGLTTIQLSEMAGISKSNAYSIEQGKYSVGLDVLHRIARALNCNIELIQN